MTTDTKNTLKTPQSTKPAGFTIPPKNPQFGSGFRKPNFGGKFPSNFRINQNRGSGGK